MMTQAEALTILKTGANVFLTGEPGSGKTHTINEYIKYLRMCDVEYAVTASTGIAATHIGGVTIHSWSGIGVKNDITEEDIDYIAQNERVVRRVRSTPVLIIDEISMLSADTFASVELVCRSLRRIDRPFGGMQVICVGDFFQLPPVVKQPRVGMRQIQIDGFDDDQQSHFAFGSRAWKMLNPIVCYLSEQHRQEDTDLLKALSALRSGEVTDDVRACFAGRCVEPPKKKVHTRLFPHNADVDKLNDMELGKIEGSSRIFKMTHRGAPPLIEGLKRNCLSPETLTLKVGAKVMFTKNHPEGDYVNGTLGEVMSYAKVTANPIVKTHDGKSITVEPTDWSIKDGDRTLATISQLPLRLAWAITVHKSQGMSLDSAIIDLSSAFEYGQGYVALSRVRSLKGLYLLGFNERALEVHPEVAEADNRFRELSDRAREVFGAMSQTERTDMYERFVKSSGGHTGK